MDITKAFRHVLRPALMAAGVILTCGSATTFAASFTVDPMIVNLVRGTTSQILTVTNRSKEELRFNITFFKWDQDETDPMKLEATKDLVIFPTLLTLKAGQSQKIRVGTTVPAGTTEASYRVLIEELPPPTTPASAQGSAVAMRTRLSLPIFIESTATASDRLEVTSVDLKDGKVSARIQNSGNSHQILESVIVRGLSDSASPVFERKIQGWYLLPGRTQVYQAPITAPECHSSRKAAVVATVSRQPKPVTLTLDVPPGVCAP